MTDFVKATSPSSQDYMTAMAALMSEALDSPEGLRALAAAIAAPIEQEIKRREISSLLLTRHNLPRGERAIYQKRPKVRAHWISKHGDARAQELGQDEVEVPTHRIHANPMVDVSVLKHGNIGTLTDIKTSAAEQIRHEIDKRTIRLLCDAVPPENVVVASGATLVETALNRAISIIEDQELTVKYIVMRGRRFNDLRSWQLDPQTRRELWSKGVITDKEVGKLPVMSDN